jgi:serine/threonine-protein kinase
VPEIDPRETMIGTTLSHYRILSRLGAGAMGVVYRAHDENLHRDVALKVLPEGTLATPEARERFRREALALSRLNHPHIATIHDFSRQDDTDFLVMELVEGPTLAARIAEGTLDERGILEIGFQIAEALMVAHERGVVHRDLKPENVVLTDASRVKVLDFGVATLATDDGMASTSTRAAELAAGTLLYMAPERLLGSAGDARSDVYALGVVLYVMVAGRPPFQSKPATALVYEIINAAPPPPTRIRNDLSRRLEDVILKCLEKDPGYRYQTARDVAIDLKRLAAAEARAAYGAGASAYGAGGPRAERIRSLVVLPLENLSGDAEQEFFADGMTDALIADLAQIGDLRVVSRTSAMRYKGARQPLPEIARELGVDAVVEGTVLRAGNRVRITAQLIEAASDRHVWARVYQRDLSDVLTLQGEVASSIAGEIRGQLTPTQQSRWRQARTVDPAAFDAYLRGRQHWNRRTEPELRKAVEYFKQAIEKDPSYAAAYSGLADSYNILGDLNALTPGNASASALGAAQRALELDPELAEAHTSLGFVRLFFDWSWREAELHYRRALELNPNYATAHQWYAEVLISQGRFDEAIAEARRAIEIDPISVILRTTLSDTLYFARRYDEAIEQLRRTVEFEPGFVAARTDLGRALTQAGRYPEAIASFEAALRLSGSDSKASPALGFVYAVAGMTDKARVILKTIEEQRSVRYMSAHAIGVIHMALGERDRALDWLEEAHRERDRAMVWLKVHPRLDPLRGERRFQALLEQMGLA